MRIQFEAFCHVLRGRFKERGWGWFLSGLFRRCGLELLWLLSLPLGLLGHLLGYRRLYVQTWHVGHLAGDIDTFLKEERLGLLPKRRRFITAPAKRVANHHLLRYWRAFVPIISNPGAVFALELISRRWLMRENLSRYISGYFGTQDIYRINRLWGKRAPVLQLSEKDKSWGRDELRRLGLNEKQWFVCVHVREGSYIPKNEVIQAHRNGNILGAIPAMQEIVRRGGVCIRMGDPGMTPLPSIPGVVDYAHSSSKSDRLDVVLCARARFFLGDTSGLSFVSTVFGVPVAQANMVPMEALGVRHCDVSMPKLLWSESLKRHLRFDEIMDSKIGGYFFTHQYQQAGIRVEENSPEDIQDLATEMLDRIAQRFVETSEDARLQAAYFSLFKPGHYSYGSNSRICCGFLRRHRNLLKHTDR
ncbi:MAG: TIGR04372 family glycosyltransferase [Candidatus Omnitrophota bacterium]|jgi:putative glycosyltransferase (TIGR04372 family)